MHHVIWCSALFTSIPIEPAINIIEKHLKEDTDLHNRTNMKIQHIISLLRFCLNNSYFSFQGRFYQQTEVAAMGSSFSPIVANLFMEDLEVQAIKTSSTPLHYGRDMCMIHSLSLRKKIETASCNILTPSTQTSSSPVKKW